MRKDIKDMINKRKIAYIYLLHRMFDGSPAYLLKVMKIPNVTVADIQDWDLDYKEAVYKTIEEEDMRGVALKNPTADVPSIKGIKEKVLRRVDALISSTEDPARLAQVYKTLSDYEVADDRKDRSVLDAINDIVKPLTQKQKEKKMTMLDKMRQQNAAPETPKEDADEEETTD